ncbi:hypothetical protein ABTM94_19640, partial [Acinetobacter baumannii]
VTGIAQAIEKVAVEARPLIVQAGYGRREWQHVDEATGETVRKQDLNEVDPDSPDLVRWWETLALMTETAEDPARRSVYESYLAEY